MDHDNTAESPADAVWPEFEADKLLRGSTSRSLTLDTSRASSDGRLLEVSSSLNLIRTRLSSLEHFVLESPAAPGIDDATLERISTFEHALSQTQAQFDDLANRVSQSEEHVTTTMVSSVDGFDTRIALVEDARLAQTSEINELTGYLEQAFTRITELAEVIENNKTSQDNTLASIETQLEPTQTRASIAALENAVGELTRRADESSASLEAQVNQISRATNAPLTDLEARIDAQADKLIEHGERVQALQDQTEATVSAQNERIDKHETELGHQYEDLTRYREVLAQHSETLKAHEQTLVELNSATDDDESSQDLRTDHGAIAEEQIETLRNHDRTLSDHTDVLSEHDQSITELYSRLDASDNETGRAGSAEVDAQARELQANKAAVEHVERIARDNGDRITSVVGTNELLGQRIDLIEQESLNIATSANDALSTVGQSESELRAVEQQVDKANEAIESALARIEELEATESAESAGSSDAQSELRSELDDAKARVAAAVSATQELEIAIELSNNELRQKVENLVESEAGLEAQITQIDQRVGSVEYHVLSQAEQSPDDETAQVASDAKDLAENLRVIQTDVVRTFKGELNTQEARLAQLEQTHEAAGELASAERVQQLETKLVEALQTISQLTQLQRRHTTVESQITDALGATNQGVEHTQQHVVALRSELEQANARIARLEAALGATTGQVAQPVTPTAPAAPTAEASTAPAQTATETAQPISDVEFTDDDDTSWFTESYQRRNAS